MVGVRYDKQLAELKDKGYFTMADGTRSDEVDEPGKKKKAKSESTKTGKKRQSAMGAKKEAASGKKQATGAKKGAKSKDEDDLDIESEASPVEESDWAPSSMSLYGRHIDNSPYKLAIIDT